MTQTIKPTLFAPFILSGANNNLGVIQNQNVIVEGDDLGESVGPTIYSFDELGNITLSSSSITSASNGNGTSSAPPQDTQENTLYLYDIVGRGGLVSIQCLTEPLSAFPVFDQPAPVGPNYFNSYSFSRNAMRIAVYKETLPGSGIFDYNNPVNSTVINNNSTIYSRYKDFRGGTDTTQDVQPLLEILGEKGVDYQVGISSYAESTIYGDAGTVSMSASANRIFTYISVSLFGAPSSQTQTIVIYDPITNEVKRGANLPPGAIAKYIQQHVTTGLSHIQQLGNIPRSEWTSLLP